MRVFLDTNVIASATATRGLCADVLRTAIEFHELVVSDHLLDEVRRILKDKFGASTALIRRCGLASPSGHDRFRRNAAS